jgi:hypothetical protein
MATEPTKQSILNRFLRRYPGSRGVVVTDDLWRQYQEARDDQMRMIDGTIKETARLLRSRPEPAAPTWGTGASCLVAGDQPPMVI